MRFNKDINKIQFAGQVIFGYIIIGIFIYIMIKQVGWSWLMN